jgi:hypothetical protein
MDTLTVARLDAMAVEDTQNQMASAASTAAPSRSTMVSISAAVTI